jgi:hypothetical protein
MPLKPEERRLKELGETILAPTLEALRAIYTELHSLVRLLQPTQQTKDPITSEQSTRKENGEPKPELTIRTVTEFGNTQIEQHQRDQQGTRDFKRRYLRVQWCIVGATILAFFAAAYYALVARQQRDTMEKQWNTMHDTLIEAQEQTKLFRQQLEATTGATVRIFGSFGFDSPPQQRIKSPSFCPTSALWPQRISEALLISRYDLYRRTG